ncbi:MAG: galactokinase [Verrucomicrobiota bacterium]|nr:galactokinase [Verrucomicrobiota bacterium]
MKEIQILAPGRAELLGNHTDYNEGYVMSIAVDRFVNVKAKTLVEPVLRFHSKEITDQFEIGLNFSKQTNPTWTNYPLGVVEQFQKLGHKLGGFSMEISSTVPMGAGLSSSAALEVATALVITNLFDIRLSQIEIAQLCQRAENEFVGVKCGLLDQISSLFGKKDQAIIIDCRSTKVENVPLGDDVSFVIANTNVKHALVGGEYNERRDSCYAAAQLLGVPFLRDADQTRLDEKIPDKASPQYRRAAHVIGENERVKKGIEDLQTGRYEAFGQKMFASHSSSIVNFENSTRELDLMVEEAKKIPGCLGARLSGGGFGGATINLVKRALVENFTVELAKKYLSRTGVTPTVFECRAADGAKSL